ncbi:ATP-binding cassette domain-containing protein [Rhodocytophaga aerolata]|uniref:ATP-binding cassette domain-containing protein n=1 Tax=Rhodocytophaga aerolata TaxID=455078 RepID=A0ABT8R446_9BACT|nr:ATP-binding cassette domain-containing protein [Rhodocytophaga aerolata]MDO1446169.1 ATP-binding cassette domain-containing protein [Rhodocytophaga aerolata]
MQIHVENLGKKFNRDWIFRNLSTSFSANQSYAITGANGSGKSTLLQTLAGILPPTEGKLTFLQNQKTITPDEFFRYLVMATPYQELIEEFTLIETVTFHTRFKPLRKGITTKEFVELIYLPKAFHKPVKFFSSGMKQRLKLGLAFYSDTPILLLDEPTSNLDKTGVTWYNQQIAQNLHNRIVIICSNQPYEYEFCKKILHIEDAYVNVR